MIAGPLPGPHRAVAVVYTGGTLAHLLRLALGFDWTDMPYWVDWAVVVLGTYGGLGLARHADRVAWRGRWERIVHWLIVVHLLVSAAVHLHAVATGSHAFFAAFPEGYSYFAVVYFGFFGWRSWTVRLRPAAV